MIVADVIGGTCKTNYEASDGSRTTNVVPDVSNGNRKTNVVPANAGNQRRTRRVAGFPLARERHSV